MVKAFSFYFKQIVCARICIYVFVEFDAVQTQTNIGIHFNDDIGMKIDGNITFGK